VKIFADGGYQGKDFTHKEEARGLKQEERGIF
jgi:hypothetical protein